MERASLITVARKAGVSKTTASLVLNGKADRVHIAQATQAHVKEIAKKLNYHPAVFNPGRLNGRTGIIGLLAENYTNLNNASWLHFLSQKAHNQGYVIVPKIATNNNAVDIAEHFPADGFILLDKNIKTSPLEKINKIVNVVCAGFQIGNFPFVAPDYSLQINELIAALYRRNKRAIGYLDIKENTAEQTTKLNAYKENYCQRFGIPENIVLPKNSNSKALTEACFQLVKNGANGIILGSNEVAEMALKIESIRNAGTKGVIFACPESVAGQQFLPEDLLVTSEEDFEVLAEKAIQQISACL